MSRRSTVLLAFLVLMALLLGSARFPRFDSRSSTRSRLAEALGPRRFAEGRMTGGFAYAPFDPAQETLKPSKQLRSVLRDVQNEGQGLAKMIDGKPRQAIAELEQAVAAGPDSAALFSDLAAAYLEDARKNREPYSLVKALESAEKAVALDPNLPEARFNRALALEKLFLHGQARLAWEEYLRLDRETPWGREASSRLRILDSPDPASRWVLRRGKLDQALRNGDQALVVQTVSSFPQATREYAEEKLLGDWAEAWAAGRSEEARIALAAVRAIGDALENSNGERMPAATVNTIDRAVLTGGGILTALVDGHRAYHKGMSLYKEGQFEKAAQVFARAERLLQQASSPFADWAGFRLAVCQMQGFHYERALALLDRLQAGARASSFRSLEGRSRWVSGLILGILARPAESLAAYRSSLRAFKAIGERENFGAVSCLMAEGLRDLGDLTGAWRFHFASLRVLPDLREPARQQVVLEQAGATALRTAEPLAALSFLQEALATTPSPVNSAAWFYCLRRRALAHARLGRMADAGEDLRKARSEAARFPDLSIRGSFMGDLQAVEGKILAVQDPRGSLDRLSAAIRIYENTEYQQQLALLYAERARSSLALGRPEAAARDLDRAIQAIREQRETVTDDTLRASYLEEFRSIFEDMVGLQARLGHEALALDYAESARAQVLFELASAAGTGLPGKPLSSEEIRKHLPADVAVLEYSVLPQRLLAWVIRRDSLKLIETRISAEKIRSLSEAFRNRILSARAGAQGDPDSKLLFDRLIGDLEPALGGVKSLVLIPDRALYGIPFPALWDPSARQYLIERYSLSVAPSANLYLRALASASSLGRHPSRRVLVMGNPKFDRELLPQLPSLPQAESEARSIAAHYPEARLLLSENATRRAFFEGLSDYDVVHVAGHAASNTAAPLSSFLALAPAAGDSGILYARDLYRSRNVRARLVILSACSGLSGGNQSGEGVVNLARPFLAMGVPAVVGSLWKVDDRAAKVLLVSFHRYFLSGLAAAAALRQTQVDLLSSPDPALSAPALWAGFQLVGTGEP